jgi:hypothetical protein
MLENIRQLFDVMLLSNFESDEFDIAPPYCTVPADVRGVPIPGFLCDVYENHIGRVSASYTRDLTRAERKAFGKTLARDYLYGGPVLLGADQLEDAMRRAEEWAQETWISEDESEKVVWMSVVPFTTVRNGDYLGFNTHGQVIYLCHDAKSFVLARRVEDFWRTWERLYYVGPEWWMLSPFLKDNWLLDGNSANIAAFRKAFQTILKAA